jgi:hypothetical protein
MRLTPPVTFGKINSIQWDSKDRDFSRMVAYGENPDLGAYKADVNNGQLTIFKFSDAYRKDSTPETRASAEFKGMASTVIFNTRDRESKQWVSRVDFSDQFTSERTVQALSESGKKELFDDALKLYRAYLKKWVKTVDAGIKANV